MMGSDMTVPEGLASMTYRVIGARPWSPLVQCRVSAVPYLEIKGSPGGPGAPNQAKDITCCNLYIFLPV